MRSVCVVLATSACRGERRTLVPTLWRLRVGVFSAENKLISRNKNHSRILMTKGRPSTRSQDKGFGYEGRFPLPPALSSRVSVHGLVQKAAFHTVREISIPSLAKDSLVVPVCFHSCPRKNADPGLADLMPFSVGRVQFTPMSSSAPTLVQAATPGCLSNLDASFESAAKILERNWT